MADNSISPSQCFEIGVTGTSIFSVLTVLSFYGFIKSHNRYSYLLFLALIFFCLLELPRYISLLVLRSYTDKICYSLHLVANSFYYLSISLVCYFIQAAVYQSKTTTTVAGKHIQTHPNIQHTIHTIHTIPIQQTRYDQLPFLKHNLAASVNRDRGIMGPSRIGPSSQGSHVHTSKSENCLVALGSIHDTRISTIQRPILSIKKNIQNIQKY